MDPSNYSGRSADAWLTGGLFGANGPLILHMLALADLDDLDLIAIQLLQLLDEHSQNTAKAGRIYWVSLDRAWLRPAFELANKVIQPLNEPAIAIKGMPHEATIERREITRVPEDGALTVNFPLMSRRVGVFGLLQVVLGQPELGSPSDLSSLFFLSYAASIGFAHAIVRDRVERAAWIDPNLGVLRREYLNSRGGRDVKRAEQLHRPIGVLALSCADHPLAKYAPTVARSVRNEDLVFAFNETTVLILAKDSNDVQCQAFAERLEKVLQPLRSAVSIGIATATVNNKAYDLVGLLRSAVISMTAMEQRRKTA